VQFKFPVKGLVGREDMVERQALIQREIRVCALGVLEKAVREEQVEEGTREQ
jgi:hypothetical protein